MEMGEDITEDFSGDKNDVTNKSMYFSDIPISNDINTGHYQKGGCSS